MRYMVNARKRRSSGGGRKKRRTAKQKAATRRMIAANRARRTGKKRRRSATPKVRRRKTSTTRRSPTMARKRGRKRTAGRRRATSTRRRRSSGARRRSPVTRLRRNTMYVTNPRKRRRRYRRNSYASNPRILSVLKQGAKDAGATLAGGAIARMASGFLPSLGSPYVNIAAQLALGAGIGIASRKVVGSDTARFITAGAMQVPLKNLITTFVPQAGAFLGDYDNVGAYALPGGNGVSGYMDVGDDDAGISGYEEDLGVQDVGY